MLLSRELAQSEREQQSADKASDEEKYIRKVLLDHMGGSFIGKQSKYL